MEFIKHFTSGFLVLILMMNTVFCVVSLTCETDRPLASQRLKCTCESDSVLSISWTKDGVSITTCLASSGGCSSFPSAYEFSNDVSGSIKIFNATIKSFGYSSCGNYTCDDGKAASKSLTIADFDSSLIPNWSEPPNKVGNISVTTSCFFGLDDFTAVWYIYIDSKWEEYNITGSKEVTTLTSDSSTCTSICGTTKAAKVIATLEHTSQTEYIESELGLKLIHKYYPNKSLPIWNTTKKYKLYVSECKCGFYEGLWNVDIAAIVLNAADIGAVIALILIIKLCDWNPPSWLKIVVTILIIAIALIALIIGSITVAWKDKCRNCTATCDIPKCDKLYRMGIANIVLLFINLILLVIWLLITQGWCGKCLTCLNTVLPVCKDTEAKGPPYGKSDNPAAKEKHREVKLLTHKEQTQQHHKETAMKKGKPIGEKHEELSEGQPQPLSVPTGNKRDDTGSAGAVSRQDVVLDRRPMHEIPSDRHKRCLSANFNDDHDKPLDDNIVHTLPVVKKPKTALNPMNAEDQSKNADDQPKKKKKKKKDRDTSRSEEMEDGY